MGVTHSVCKVHEDAERKEARARARACSSFPTCVSASEKGRIKKEMEQKEEKMQGYPHIFYSRTGCAEVKGTRTGVYKDFAYDNTFRFFFFFSFFFKDFLAFLHLS